MGSSVRAVNREPSLRVPESQCPWRSGIGIVAPSSGGRISRSVFPSNQTAHDVPARRQDTANQKSRESGERPKKLLRRKLKVVAQEHSAAEAVCQPVQSARREGAGTPGYHIGHTRGSRGSHAESPTQTLAQMPRCAPRRACAMAEGGAPGASGTQDRSVLDGIAPRLHLERRDLLPIQRPLPR